jgi:murein DD-endopeptidase MepM/ murein hydrolase activator NlpD
MIPRVGRHLAVVLVPFLAASSGGWGSRVTKPAISCGEPLTVSWTPESPRRGALFRVRVGAVPANAELSGSVAGEALHFGPTKGETGFAESFAAVPIDGPDSIGIRVRCTLGDQTDTLVARPGTARGNYRIERLRVAPSFGKVPDSALAARIDREAARALDVARQSHDTPRLWTQPFLRPRDSRVTSGFGHGREYNGTITSRHMGTDFAGATGAIVRASNRGVVRIVDEFYYGGKVVYVDHGAGLTTAYLHLSAQLVTVGDTVARGQTIGRVGATGRVTGPHLHLIVRYGAVTVDPLSLFTAP